jgi:hypothetical protein
MGTFKEGDLCVYFELDSIVREIPEFAFLEKVKYRIKTCKLRGEVSQGLVMPLSILKTVNGDYAYLEALNTLVFPSYKIDETTGEKHIEAQVGFPIVEGMDVTEALGVKKHDPDVQGTYRLSSLAKGRFPEWLRKTDAERIQSMSRATVEEFHDKVFGCSLKMDGTSFTAYLKDGEFGVCSRNLDLKRVEAKESVYWLIAEKYDLENKMREFSYNNKWNLRNFAVQGEILGPSIQKNPLRLAEPELQIFDVFDIDKQSYVMYDEEIEITEELG